MDYRDKQPPPSAFKVKQYLKILNTLGLIFIVSFLTLALTTTLTFTK